MGQRRPQRVVLTGGSGDLGSVASRLLARRGDRPLRLDLRESTRGAGEAMLGSVLDRGDLDVALHGADVVVHAAAWHGVHEFRRERSDDEFWQLNVTGTYEVFEACRRAGVSRIVYLSSESVSDTSSTYGLTKRLGEELARDYAQRHGMRVLSLRARAFIPHYNRDVYADFLEWANWFWKGAVHVDDVAIALLGALEWLHSAPSNSYEAVTVDGRYEYSARDLAVWNNDGPGSSFRRHYARYYDLALRYELPIDLPPVVLGSEKARALFGYEPTYSLENLLQDLERFGRSGPPPPEADLGPR
jgi:nucleoside-diphosphate-sugar epimerase